MGTLLDATLADMNTAWFEKIAKGSANQSQPPVQRSNRVTQGMGTPAGTSRPAAMSDGAASFSAGRRGNETEAQVTASDPRYGNNEYGRAGNVYTGTRRRDPVGIEGALDDGTSPASEKIRYLQPAGPADLEMGQINRTQAGQQLERDRTQAGQQLERAGGALGRSVAQAGGRGVEEVRRVAGAVGGVASNAASAVGRVAQQSTPTIRPGAPASSLDSMYGPGGREAFKGAGGRMVPGQVPLGVDTKVRAVQESRRLARDKGERFSEATARDASGLDSAENTARQGIQQKQDNERKNQEWGQQAIQGAGSAIKSGAGRLAEGVAGAYSGVARKLDGAAREMDAAKDERQLLGLPYAKFPGGPMRTADQHRARLAEDQEYAVKMRSGAASATTGATGAVASSEGTNAQVDSDMALLRTGLGGADKSVQVRAGWGRARVAKELGYDMSNASARTKSLELVDEAMGKNKTLLPGMRFNSVSGGTGVAYDKADRAAGKKMFANANRPQQAAPVAAAPATEERRRVAAPVPTPATPVPVVSPSLQANPAGPMTGTGVNNQTGVINKVTPPKSPGQNIMAGRAPNASYTSTVGPTSQFATVPRAAPVQAAPAPVPTAQPAPMQSAPMQPALFKPLKSPNVVAGAVPQNMEPTKLSMLMSLREYLRS